MTTASLPERAAGVRRAGLLMPVFAMPGELGIGDTASVMTALEFCYRHGIGALQVLPVSDPGLGTSPYDGSSSTALSPDLLRFSPEMMPGLRQEHLDAVEPEVQRLRLRTGPVNYQGVRAVKGRLARLAFEHFEQQTGSVNLNLKSDFLQFTFDHGNRLNLAVYTLFRALADLFRTTDWTTWPKEFADFNQAEQTLKRHPQGAEIENRRRFCAWLQWVGHIQWSMVRQYARNLHIRLIGDMPFGISRLSADLWGQDRDSFEQDWWGGAPPEPTFQTDPFTTQFGQNWGIAVPNWKKHEAQDLDWWKRRIESLALYFNEIRFDHVLGLFRLYCFPWSPSQNHDFLGMTADQVRQTTGDRHPEFRPRPDDEQGAPLNRQEGTKRLRALQDFARHRGSSLIGEDMGWVPEYMNDALAEVGVPGFYVPHWYTNHDGSFRPAPDNRVGVWTTHDHPPLIQLYQDLLDHRHGKDGRSGDESWRRMLHLMDFLGRRDQQPPTEFGPELLADFQQTLLKSACPLVVFTLMDLLGIDGRWNVPGTTAGCWTHRLGMSWSEIEDDDKFAPGLKRFRDLVIASGRWPQ